ncbi:hypothetical protein LIER_25249 [Lithospermum erythrorhizon]|uniref:WW domain-containing protein n=1 Tax=Lithospermum erythrorhizon TaxID=34254 RepID=A0AAV3R5L1_LITER
MEFPELSLAPNTASEHDNNLPMKRKSAFAIQNSVDLQSKEPLPLDWEQCLDLESGKVYYLNRKTLRRTWEWPEEQILDLELNMSSYNRDQRSQLDELNKKQRSSSYSSSSSKSSMIALACSNCHLLVILSQSSPSCPNCKYVHSLQPSSPPPKITTTTTSWGSNNPHTANFFDKLSF